MRILITGVNGFTGRHLASRLSAAHHEVIGLCHRPAASPPGVTRMYVADLGDQEALARVVSDTRPELVAHLAAISFVAHGDADAIYQTNLLGTRHLLEALARSNAPLHSVLLASSANVYGNATGGVIDEETPPKPANDYAVSKLAMEHLARLYSDRLPIVITRPFNYTGAGQAESFLIPKIVSHARRKAEVIELGNLDVARDFSDVRMVAEYYQRLLLCEGARGGTFNVCSGRAYTLRDVLELVSRISGHDLEVRINPAFVRTNEVKILLGDRRRLLQQVGEAPEFPLAETIQWMLSGNA